MDYVYVARWIKKPEQDAEILTSDRALADYYEAAVRAYREPKKVGNWIISELLRELGAARLTPDACQLQPEGLAKLVEMIDAGTISGTIGKKIFPDLFAMGADPARYCQEKGLVQISDSSELEVAVAEVIAAHPKECERYRAGDKKLMGFFVGQVMKKTRGQANPKVLGELLAKQLG